MIPSYSSQLFCAVHSHPGQHTIGHWTQRIPFLFPTAPLNTLWLHFCSRSKHICSVCSPSFLPAPVAARVQGPSPDLSICVVIREVPEGTDSSSIPRVCFQVTICPMELRSPTISSRQQLQYSQEPPHSEHQLQPLSRLPHHWHGYFGQQ